MIAIWLFLIQIKYLEHYQNYVYFLKYKFIFKKVINLDNYFNLFFYYNKRKNNYIVYSKPFNLINSPPYEEIFF